MIWKDKGSGQGSGKVSQKLRSWVLPWCELHGCSAAGQWNRGHRELWNCIVEVGSSHVVIIQDIARSYVERNTLGNSKVLKEYASVIRLSGTQNTKKKKNYYLMPWMLKAVRFILSGRKCRWPKVDRSERHGKSYPGVLRNF